VWAWRRGRIRKIARRVDRLACIFPFEPEVYADTGLAAEFVGHPLVDRLGEPAAGELRAELRRSLDLDPDRPLVVLLPGSRRNELRHSLDLHLAAARALHARDPRPAYAVALAPSLQREDAEPALARAALPSGMRVDLVQGHTHALMRAADVAVTKPGTVTVELALLEVPMVVLARINPLSAFAIRRLIRVPAWAMPNLIAGRPVVPEFLQEDTDPQAVASALRALLDGPARSAQCSALREVRTRLGGGGAAERAAEIAEEMLDGSAGA
jgi:lipid-A-disaccharide synthase